MNLQEQQADAPEAGPDAALIARAVQGENDAWVQIVRQQQEAIFRLAWLLLGDATEAEDVAQETFLHAYRALARFDGTRPLRPWLLQIAHNLASNRRRGLRRAWKRLQRFFAGMEDAQLASHAVELQAESDVLWRSIRQLDAADQQIIYLRYYLELSVDECAQSLEVAPGTIKSRLHRALARLRVVAHKEFAE